MFGTKEDWIAAAVANLIGGCIFFWVDRFIFKSKTVEKWEVTKYGKCHDCRKAGFLKRLVYAPGGYDKTKDNKPEFRCQECSDKKLKQLIDDKKVKV